MFETQDAHPIIDSWTTDNESPRTDTKRMTVAMLSERLHNLCRSSFHPWMVAPLTSRNESLIGPPASVPLQSGNAMDTMEMANDHGPSVQSR